MEKYKFEKKYSVEMLNDVVHAFQKELTDLLQKESPYTKEKNNLLKQVSDSIDSLKGYPEHIKNKLKEEQMLEFGQLMGGLEEDYKKLIQETIANLDNLIEETKSHLEEFKKETSGILEVDQMSEEHILRAAISSVEMMKKNFPRNK